FDGADRRVVLVLAPRLGAAPPRQQWPAILRGRRHHPMNEPRRGLQGVEIDHCFFASAPVLSAGPPACSAGGPLYEIRQIVPPVSSATQKPVAKFSYQPSGRPSLNGTRTTLYPVGIERFHDPFSATKRLPLYS